MASALPPHDGLPAPSTQDWAEMVRKLVRMSAPWFRTSISRETMTNDADAIAHRGF
jgi:hypothetical protein